MRFVKCPVCKTRIPRKSESCPLCDTKYTKYQYFRMHHTAKVVAGILLVVLLYNVTIVIIENRQIRKYMRTPPESIEQIEKLEEDYKKLNFFQKYFVHESEIQYLRKSFEGRREKGVVTNQETTIYFDNGSIRGIYSGETYGGEPDGIGRFEYVNNNGTNCVYEGEFLEGEMSGYGTLKLSTGQKCIGNFRAGSINGFATVYNSDDTVNMQGQFVNGRLNGDGVMYDDFGNVIYQGVFSQGRPLKSDYLKICTRTFFEDLRDDLYDYQYTNIKITGVINDIVIDEQTSSVQYIIHSGDSDNNIIHIEYKGPNMRLAIDNSVTIYGYCKGMSKFHDSAARTRNGLSLIGYYITKNL